jgi:hypothetical protein
MADNLNATLLLGMIVRVCREEVQVNVRCALDALHFLEEVLRDEILHNLTHVSRSSSEPVNARVPVLVAADASSVSFNSAPRRPWL